jgi:phosphatidylglycerol---prolipoprotein diacylglyceryl transferase
MHPIIYDFGSFSLKSYGLMLAIAFITGIYLAKRQAVKEGVDGNFLDSLSFGIIISAIIGARLLHVVAEEPEHYWKYPLDILKINTGGLAFYGGLIFAVGFSIYYCRRKKTGFFKIADIIAPSIALGLTFARMGCFLAGCCYGKACDLPWGVTFTNPLGAGLIGTRLHPTQIYESLASLVIFFILIVYRKHKRFEGELFAVLILTYSIARFLLEFLRADNRGSLGPLSTSQLIGIPLFIFATYLLIAKRGKKTEKKE